MRIIDVFNKVTVEEIADILVKNHSSNYDDKEKTVDIVKRFYEDISSIVLEDISSNEEYKDFTVIVNEYYDENSFKGESVFELAERYREKDFDFSSVTEDTLDKYFVVDGINLHELIEKKDNIITDFKEYLEASKDHFEDFYVTSYGLDFIPRRIILACEIADLSIEKFGLATCATEIFWELTFYGLTENQVQAESDNLGKRVEEVKEEKYETLEEADLDDNFEIDNRDIDFSIEFSKRVNEYDHRICYDFYKEMAEKL